MTKVAVLSDTHGLLREDVKKILRDVDVILHAGDINTPMIVEELESFAPLYIVRGNNDKEWAEHLPASLVLELENLRIYIVHNKKHIPKDLGNIDIVVFGHSHKYLVETKDNITFINPGSCGKRRFDLEISMCIMTINHGTFEIEKVVFQNT